MISQKVVYIISIMVAIAVFFVKRITFESPCFIGSEGVLSPLFRKPLNCEVCVNATSIDVVHHIDQIEFEERYAYSGRPLVVRAAAKNWTAIDSFDYEFFKNLNEVASMAECQFINYNEEFRNVEEAFDMELASVILSDKSKWWYFGWSVCNPLAVRILRQYYEKPYFLPKTSENYIVDWIFMGTTGYGAAMHIDDVHLPSWQAQIKGTKKWTLRTPTECLYLCQDTFYVDVLPGDIIVLDTNLWYHATKVISEDISITVGAEYD